jgi:hypothetical protein
LGGDPTQPAGGIVQVDFSIYGAVGPWANRIGFDQTAGGASGVLALEGSVEEPKLPEIFVVNDYISSWIGMVGAIAALRRRATEGGHTFSGHTESKNPVELPACPYEFDGRSKCEGDVMGQTTHHYLIFETDGGFCGIAWNNVGITRFQLPTKSAEATERTLLRRLPCAERGAPTPEVVEAVAAVSRYFEGDETDFSGFSSTSAGRTLSSSKSMLQRGGSDGAARRPMVPWRRNSAPGQTLRGMSVKPWPRIRWR